MNVVILKGNVTRDIQLSYTPNQTEVAEFGLAINEKRGDSEKTHFVDLTCFGKRANVLNDFVKNGDPLLVRGKLDFQQWEKDGQKRTKLKVIVEDFEFISTRKQQRDPEPEPQYQSPPQTDEDIPF